MILNQRDIKRAREAIIQAKKELDKSDYNPVYSAQGAAYRLRDLVATKEAGLSDLAWAMCKEYPHKNDVLGLIEHLEKYLSQFEKGE